jgi:hypothetical protein
MQIVLIENKMITEGKQSDIESRIYTAAGRIPESLQRHDFFKRRIKKVDAVQNCSPEGMVQIFH